MRSRALFIRLINRGYRDRVNRSDRRVRDKEYEDRYQLNTDLGLGRGEIKARKGGSRQNMLRILRETTGNLSPLILRQPRYSISLRPQPTSSILKRWSSTMVILLDAMMASMSVPGALPPYGGWANAG